MRTRKMLALTLGGAWLAAVAGSAAAATCYVVLDRTDAVIYRDVVPPFDLSDSKALDSSGMRARGEHLLIAEFDNCDRAGFISPTTGGTTASVEDIVTELKPAIAPSVGTRKGTAAAKSATPAAAPPAAKR